MIFSESGRVYVAVGNTDMRKSINGLSILVEQAMDLNPFSGDLFVFCNRLRNIVKNPVLGSQRVLPMAKAFGKRTVQMTAID